MMIRIALLIAVLSVAAGPAAAQSRLVGTLEELRARADQLFKEERYDEARDAYLQIQAAFAKEALLNRNLGTAYLRSTKPNLQEAIRFWTISWQIDGSEDLRLEAANIYLRSGQWRPGTRFLTDLATEHPQHPEHWLAAARAAEQARQYPSAIAWYARYLARQPADMATRLTRARLLGWEKRYDEATQDYAIVLKAAPRNVEARIATAQLLAWQSAFPESVARYDEVLKEQPNNLDAQRGKAFALLWMGRAQEAQPIFEEVSRRRRGDKEVLAALNDIARIEAEAAAAAVAPPPDPLAGLRGRIDAALRDNDLTTARARLDEGLAANPGDVGLRRRLVQLHLASNNVRGAIDVLTALRDEQPSDTDVLRELAWAQMRDTDLSSAIATLIALIDVNPADRAARIDLARVLSWSRRFDEASAHYRAVLGDDPSNTDSRIGLAQLDAWQGRYAAALDQFEAILRDAPDQREALIGRAQAIFWLGRRDEAFAAVSALEQRLPDDREVVALAESLRTAARAAVETPPDPAARRVAYETALAARPNDVEALNGLGDLEFAAGQFAIAASLYRKALAIRADDVTARLSLARALSQTRAYEEAAHAYEAVLVAQPDNRAARLELARILSWDGRYDASLRVYGEALSRAPGDKDALVERARVLSWKGDLDRAIRLFGELQTQYPADRDVLLGKGQALQWSGRAVEAERILAPLRAAYPDDRDVRVALAGTQLALGRSDLAWQEIEAAGGRRSDSADVQLMRSLVLRQIRPVLTVGYSPSLDSDDLRIEPWAATLFFSAIPRVRSYLRGAYIPSQLPGVGEAEGRAALFGSTIQLSPQALLRGEAGVNITRERPADPIGRIGGTPLPSRHVRIELDADRQFIDYLPAAVENHISRDAVRTGLDVRPVSRVLLHADYTYGRYSDDNRAHGGGFTASYAFANRERLAVEAGYLYTINTFSDDFGSGYYAPSRLQRHSSLLNVSVRPARWIGWAFAGTLGQEQAVDDPFRIDGTARLSLELSPTTQIKWIGGYGYFRVASLSRAGAYLTHSVFTSLELRF
jgi:tetratricopeptide (TPR) repeat protein